MKWLLPLLLACTFSREKREDASLRESEHARVVAEQRETETRTEGPGRTVVYKFGPVEDAQSAATLRHPLVKTTDSDPATRAHASGSRSAAPAKDSLPPHGPLVEMDVIDTGPVLDTKATKATETAAEDVGLDLRYRGTEHDKDAPALAGFLWIALLVGAIGLGVWLAWRFSLPGRVMALFK